MKLLLSSCVLFISLILPPWALGQLVVLPSAGKSLGSATAPESGKWIVFAAGFNPVQPTVLDGGKTIVWEGPAGDYAVIFIPPAPEAQPLVQKVVLGGTSPEPTPNPPLPPGQRWGIIWEETKERTPAQAALRTKAKQDKSLLTFWVDVSNPPESWQAWKKLLPATQSLPALLVIQGDRLVRVSALPASVEALKQEITR